MNAPAASGASPSSPGAGGATSNTQQPAEAAASSPAPGTIVAKTGNIAIQTTSVPYVLLANNAPGQQDPRMANASSILLGAKKDVQLEGGTKMVVGIAPASGQ